jgi:uncharacterized protein YcfL
MKKLSLFLLLIVFIIGCGSNKTPNTNASTNTSTPATTSATASIVPTDNQILSAILSKENNGSLRIYGKRKISDNEYQVYIVNSNEINYYPYTMVALDNGKWLVNKPGYYMKEINIR